LNHDNYLKIIEKHQISVGDELIIDIGNITYQGILIPTSEYNDKQNIVIKLKNGYNVGIDINKIKSIKKTGVISKLKFSKSKKYVANNSLPRICIIGTGGTIASRVDYRTGAVKPALSAHDLYSLIPELSQIAQIACFPICNVYSEHIEMKHWKIIANSIMEKINENYVGAIVTHGTDTMGYTSAALSFVFQNCPIPIILVGSQRSPDRPSSDAMLNLIGATKIIAEKKLSGVYVAMHSNMSNHQIVIHQGTSVRKNHTSRRDAFTSINREPVAYVEKNKISYTNINEKNSQKFNFSSKFDERVHLLKFHPSSNPKILDFLVKQNYKGVIIEGTGLGHVSSNWYNSIKNAVNSGVIIGITSQCIAGRVSLNVYDTGRDLLSFGVIPLEDIVPETALTKLMWVLGNYKNIDEAKKIMLTNLTGEFSTRSLSTLGKY